MADQQRIQQVLVNLLGNAIKFSGPGKSIVVSAQRVNGSVSVSVRDEGPGIPADAIPRLFDKFYRVRGPSGGPSNGTGLGLYITKQIVNAHGGQIDVRSEVGGGSEFYFTLPANGGPGSAMEVSES
jgi:signal transduction histidine kinase